MVGIPRVASQVCIPRWASGRPRNFAKIVNGVAQPRKAASTAAAAGRTCASKNEKSPQLSGSFAYLMLTSGPRPATQ